MTLIVNLFGAPGAGKSTTATGVFHKIKLLGINAEYLPEVAKDFTWEKRGMALACQPYVFAKQLRNTERLLGQVDVIVTDSPLLLSVYYGRRYADHYPESLWTYMAEQFAQLGGAPYAGTYKAFGLNYYIRRVKQFNPAGRNQTEQESDEVAAALAIMLDEYNTAAKAIDGDENAVDTIVHEILNYL